MVYRTQHPTAENYLPLLYTADPITRACTTYGTPHIVFYCFPFFNRSISTGFVQALIVFKSSLTTIYCGQEEKLCIYAPKYR